MCRRRRSGEWRWAGAQSRSAHDDLSRAAAGAGALAPSTVIMRMLRGVAAAAGDAERARSMDGSILRAICGFIAGSKKMMA